MTYDNPFDFIHDVVNAKVPLSAVTMEDWIHGCSLAMIMKQEPDLEVDVQYKGGIYKCRHHLVQINPPMSNTKKVLETKQ